MAANAVVRARVEAKVKEEAAAIYAAAGLTISDAFRMMLMRTVADRALPFDPLVPNAETVAAMRAARHGELKSFGSVEDLMPHLHADDEGDGAVQEGLQASGGASMAKRLMRL